MTKRRASFSEMKLRPQSPPETQMFQINRPTKLLNYLRSRLLFFHSWLSVVQAIALICFEWAKVRVKYPSAFSGVCSFDVAFKLVCYPH